MAIGIEFLKNKNKEKFYPVTHINAIIAGDTTLDQFVNRTASSTNNGLMSSNDKTKLDKFVSADQYALKTEVSAIYNFKGTVATKQDLPSSGNKGGDAYYVTSEGTNFAWNGTEWTNMYGNTEATQVISVELPYTSWSNDAPYTQTVTVTEMTSGREFGAPWIDSVEDTTENAKNLLAFDCITGGYTSDGSVTFWCAKYKPEKTITIKMRGVK